MTENKARARITKSTMHETKGSFCYAQCSLFNRGLVVYSESPPNKALLRG